MTDSAQRARGPRLNLIFIDHSGQPGGGQLGLQRYLTQHSIHGRSVVFISGGPVADQLAAAGVRTHVLFPGAVHSRGLLLRSISRLRTVLNEASDDSIVIANSGYAALALSLTGLPRRRMVNYLRTEASPPDSVPIKRWFDTRFVLHRFGAYLTNSEWTRGTLPHSVASKPALVAYPLSGVSSSDADGRPEPLRHGREIRIASFSRLDQWKGIDTLIDAVQVVAESNPSADVKLDIYGGQFFADEAFAGKLKAMAAHARIPIAFHGHVDDVPARLHTTDIVVVPSRYPEPFGQVVAQSISHGCVTITSNHGGAIEQVTDGVNGLTFEPGDVASLASALELCIREPARASQLTHGAAAFGESMDDRTLAGAFDKAIASISEQLLRG